MHDMPGFIFNQNAGLEIFDQGGKPRCCGKTFFLGLGFRTVRASCGEGSNGRPNSVIIGTDVQSLQAISPVFEDITRVPDPSDPSSEVDQYSLSFLSFGSNFFSLTLWLQCLAL